jgi:hypothetical protein
MSIYLVAGCIAIGFAIGCPFGVGAAMWGMMDWQNGRRERIAAMAMQGMLSNSNLVNGSTTSLIADWAVDHADALIERLDSSGKGWQS